jgi:hypothetical protein
VRNAKCKKLAFFLIGATGFQSSFIFLPLLELYNLLLFFSYFRKMIHHIVLMRFKESLSEAEVAKIMADVRHLKVTIPQIFSFSDGVNCSVEGLAKGFTHAFTILFETTADRDAYLVHPDHVHLANNILVPNLKDGVEGAIVFDYEA